MSKVPVPGVTAQDLDLVAGLVQRGELYVDVGGAWVAPEVDIEKGRLVLYAYSPEAVEESE